MDTAGQERFRSINNLYCKSANCCLLVYDISDRKSFDECKTYFNNAIKNNCLKGIPVIVLGNKTDLEEQRKVPPEEGANFSAVNNYIFMETSCLKNKNVSDAFATLIEITHRKVIQSNENTSDDDEQNNNITITNKNKNKDKNSKDKKNHCC